MNTLNVYIYVFVSGFDFNFKSSGRQACEACQEKSVIVHVLLIGRFSKKKNYNTVNLKVTSSCLKTGDISNKRIAVKRHRRTICIGVWKI